MTGGGIKSHTMNKLGKTPPAAEITPEPLYLRRREFMRNALLFTVTSTSVGGSLLWLMGGNRTSELKSAPVSVNAPPLTIASRSSSSTDEPMTPYRDAPPTITLMGKPPALPGDSQSLTVPGIATSLHSVNRSPGHGKETDRERQPNPKPYEMGMQIPCRVYPQRAAQSAVRPTARRLGRGVPGAGPTEGEQGGGGASAPGSRPHVALDSAEVRGVAGGGVSQGEECNLHCAHVWREGAQLCRRAVLGAGVLCLDPGPG